LIWHHSGLTFATISLKSARNTIKMLVKSVNLGM